MRLKNVQKQISSNRLSVFFVAQYGPNLLRLNATGGSDNVIFAVK